MAENTEAKEEVKEVAEELKTGDLLDQEIFSAGTWNGEKYTNKDLDHIVNAYKETAESIKIPIKLSHQHPAAFPAVGWVENVRRIGSKLIADFRRIPKTIYDIIMAGGYRQKSAEIYWDFERNGKIFKRMLKAVALLGIDPKAVENINDLAEIYTEDPSRTGDVKFCDTKEEQKMEPENGKPKTEERNYAQEILDMKTKIEEMTKKLENTEKESEALVTKVNEYKLKEARDGVNAVITKLVGDGQLAPSCKEKAFDFLISVSAGVRSYSVDGKEVSIIEEFPKLFSGLKVDAVTAPATKSGSFEGADLKTQAEAYAKEHKVSYVEALRQIYK